MKKVFAALQMMQQPNRYEEGGNRAKAHRPEQGNQSAKKCITAYCIHHNTYDPGIPPGSANQCIPGDVYLRSNL